MWVKNFRDLFRNKKNEEHHIKDDSFLDVHHIYDKDDFIFSWKELLDSNPELWRNALEKKSTGKKILTVTLGGGFTHRHIMYIDNILNIALTLRGANVETFLCDHALPVCMKAEYAYIKPEVIHHSQISQTLCKGCYKDSFSVALQLGLTAHMLSAWVTLTERQKAKEISQEIPISEIKDYQIDGVAIGKHAIAGAMRYFSHSDPTQFPLGEETTKRYLEASIISYHAIMRLLKENKYEAVFVAMGSYAPHGIVKEVCEHLNIPVMCWAMNAQKRRFNITHGAVLHSLLYEPNELWENMKWGEAQEKKIMDYLNSRWDNSKDWLPIPKENKKILFTEFANEKGLDLNKPIIGMLTNIIWEAYAEYKSRVFPDMFTWLQKTINYFKSRKDLQLLIRIHPAEEMWNVSRQLAVNEIKKMFLNLPSNVFIIESNRNINTYEAMSYCDAVITYQTTTGIELAAIQGMPIIVTGDAAIRNKGIAHEPLTEDEYFNKLDQLPFKKRISEDKRTRARKYAYHVFLRKMIPLNFFEETKDWKLYESTLKKLDDLLPNAHEGLDIICDGILNGSPFIYPSEEYEQEGVVNV